MYTRPCDIARSPSVRKVGDLVRARPGKLAADTAKRRSARSASAR
jgi:hypothetical protein